MIHTSVFKFVAGLSLSLTLLVWAYYPGLDGPFIFDDYTNIANNGYLKLTEFSFADIWQAIWSSESGPLRRPLAMLSFLLNYCFSGMNPWPMKLSNLFIHLVNALLLMLIFVRVFQRRFGAHAPRSAVLFMSFAFALIWLVHPVNVSAVSYIVQRMTSLSATFVLLAIYCYLQLREVTTDRCKGVAAVFLLMLLWLCGMLTKETAILLSVYIFVIEWCCYGFKSESVLQRNLLSTVWILLALPWFFAVVYFLYEPSFILANYAYRDFSLSERLLTESRVVLSYLRLILIPAVPEMGLFQDDLILSRSLLSPVTTLLALLSVSALLFAALYMKTRLPLLSAGILWFFGGHLLESTVFPLELMFLHRNYLPSVGILLAFSEAGFYLYVHKRKVLYGLLAVVIASYAICTRFLAQQWSGEPQMLLMEVVNNPQSIRANILAGTVLNGYAEVMQSDAEKRAYRANADRYFRKVRELDRKDMSGELSLLENQLRFAEQPSALFLSELKQGLASGRLKSRSINVLKSIEDCLIKAQCHLAAGEFELLMGAAISNPLLSAEQRAGLKANFAAYILAVDNDLKRAVALLDEAIAEQPGMLDLYTLLIFYSGKQGDFRKMTEAVTELDKRDRLGRYKKYIKQTREVIKAEKPYTEFR